MFAFSERHVTPPWITVKWWTYDNAQYSQSDITSIEEIW